ncbi:MAG: hypothetical protein QOJ41_1397 [Acidobacteriaceae bacterium]|nr:hypothetical protein [Acidobacteriaceae bacterium]
MIRYLYAVTLGLRFSGRTIACGQQAARGNGC